MPPKKDQNGNSLNKDGSIRKKRAPHSSETRALISERRKARSETNPPRHAGQSARRKSLADELLHEYRRNPAVCKWVRENAIELGHLPGEKNGEVIKEKNREMGVNCEFSEMYRTTYEYSVSEILYSHDNSGVEHKSYDPLHYVEEMDNGESLSKLLWNVD